MLDVTCKQITSRHALAPDCVAHQSLEIGARSPSQAQTQGLCPASTIVSIATKLEVLATCGRLEIRSPSTSR